MTRRLAAAVLLAAMTAGCMQWAAVDLSGPPVAPEAIASDVRLLRSAGDTLVLSDASLRGDSITGLRESGVPATVALSELQSLEVRRMSPAMVLAPAVIIGFIVVPRVFNHSIRDGSGPVVTEGSQLP